MKTDEKRQWVQQIYGQHEGRLLRYTMKFTSRTIAAEIVQESFLRLLQQEAPEKIVGHELAWLFRVCRNAALDRLKKEKPMKNLTGDEEIPYEGESAEQIMDRNDEKNLAIELLKSLNPTQKEVVRLKFQEGFSYKDIAGITGHSVSHVGVILHEAISKLRKTMVEKNQPVKVVSNEK